MTLTRTRSVSRLAVTAGLTLTCLMLVGCASSHRDLPYLPGGEIQRTHPRPMEGGFYSNFDPKAHSIDVTPIEDTNPVKTQHVLVATVRDREGNPLPNRRVHWILSRGGVGDIVDVDASGWMNSRGHQVNQVFAETHTNRFSHVLDRGTSDTSDDVHLTPGQTWIVITSPIEGDTFITAYAPAIYNWEKHKVFAVKHWLDGKFKYPDPACNAANKPHTWVTNVAKASDGSGQVGWVVRYTLRAGGPKVTLAPGGGSSAEVRTDGSGNAAVVVRQTGPYQAGQTIADIVVLKPVCGPCGGPKVMKPVAKGVAVKEWDLPNLTITKTGPPVAIVCRQEEVYTITVGNQTKCASADGVVVKDTIPSQFTYVSSAPAGQLAGNTVSWTLGSLKPGETRQIRLRLKPKTRGTAVNTAVATAALAKSVRASVTTKVTQTVLKVRKTVSSPVVYLGETANFEIVITNTGDAPSLPAKLTDVFDRRGLQSISGSDVKRLEATVPSIGPGQSSAPIQVALKTIACGEFTNTAKLTCGSSCCPPQTASAKVKVVKAALKVTKTGPKWSYLKKPIPFRITVSNPASGPHATAATHVVLTDAMPAGLEFVKADSGGTAAGSQVTWPIGTLAPGQSKTVRLWLRGLQKGRFCNTVVATADRGLRDDAKACVEIRGVPGLLIEVIDTVDPIMVSPGENERTTYQIRVTNQGSKDAEQVRLVFKVPAEEKFLSTSGPTKYTVAGGAVITYAPVARIPIGGNVTYEVVVEAAKPGDARFRAEMNSKSLTRPVIEEESTHVYDGRGK